MSDLGFGQKLLDHRPHRVGAKQHRLAEAAGVENAICEDVAAVEIARDLHLIHGQELDRDIERHGLDGAHEIPRAFRDDLLFAGDQRRDRLALRGNHAIVNLARQQPEGQPDHATGVTEHALDREMGLTRVGRTQHRLGDRPWSGARAHGQTMGGCPFHFKLTSQRRPKLATGKLSSLEGTKNESIANHSI